MQLTPEQVNQFLAEAILKSKIGEAVDGAVKRMLDQLQKSYDNPFDAVIRQQAVALINEEVLKVYRPQLEAGIKKAMAAYMTDEIVEKIIASAIEKLRTRY